MRIIPLFLAFCLAAGGARAGDTPCPPALDFADRKAALVSALKSARTANAGRFLTRRLEAVRQVAPNRHAQALLDEGRALVRDGRIDAARERFDRLAAYCPDYAEAYRARAATHLAGGDLPAALADLDRATAVDPHHAGAHADRAVTLMRLGRVPQAVKALESALAINPWRPERRLLDTSGLSV